MVVDENSSKHSPRHVDSCQSSVNFNCNANLQASSSPTGGRSLHRVILETATRRHRSTVHRGTRCGRSPPPPSRARQGYSGKQLKNHGQFHKIMRRPIRRLALAESAQVDRGQGWSSTQDQLTWSSAERQSNEGSWRQNKYGSSRQHVSTAAQDCHKPISFKYDRLIIIIHCS